MADEFVEDSTTAVQLAVEVDVELPDEDVFWVV
jgi:hypothetical protein